MALTLLHRFAGLAVAAAVFCGAGALAQTYQANLGPMPLDAATNKNMLGRGEATASWDGKMLTVNGRFAGLPSPATKAISPSALPLVRREKRRWTSPFPRPPPAPCPAS